MITTIDIQFKSGSATDGDIVDRSSQTSMKHLAKTDLVEDLSGNNVIEDVETGPYLSFVSCGSVDSGFSSSDTDDRVTDGLLNESCGLCCDTDDCVTDRLLNESCGCHCDTDDHDTDGLLFVGCGFNSEYGALKIDEFIDNGDDSMMICGHSGKIVKQGHRTFINEDEKLEKGTCGCFVDESDKGNKVKCDDLVDEGKNTMQAICSRDEDPVDKIEDVYVDVGNTVNNCQSVKLTYSSEITQLDSSCERSESSELRKHATVDMYLDRTPLNTKCMNIDPGDVCDKDIGPDKQIYNRPRETADPVNSAVTSEASCKLRTVCRRRRKCHVKDVNNNIAGPRSLASFFGRVPLTFYDCFQEMGLLSLVACIIYTLVLMVILSAVGMIMETFKSAIGTRNLKKIHKNILRYRHTRMSLATG